jgi:hypothetical protein
MASRREGAVAAPPDQAWQGDPVDLDQVVERLRWTPKQRLDYLLDMLAFEERAHRARRAS